MIAGDSYVLWTAHDMLFESHLASIVLHESPDLVQHEIAKRALLQFGRRPVNCWIARSRIRLSLG